MKPLKPYIALVKTPGANDAFELSVLIQSPAGYRLSSVTSRTEEDNDNKQQDLVEFIFVTEPTALEFLHDCSFMMARTQNQDTVTVKATVPPNGPKPNNGSSSGHYGDPT